MNRHCFRPSVEQLETRACAGLVWWESPPLDDSGPDEALIQICPNACGVDAYLEAAGDYALDPEVLEETHHIHQDALTLLASLQDVGAGAAEPDAELADRLRSVYADQAAKLAPLREAAQAATDYGAELARQGAAASRVAAASVRAHGIAARYNEAANNRDRIMDLKDVPAESAAATGRRVLEVLGSRLDQLSSSVTQARHKLDKLELAGTTGKEYAEAARAYRIAVERHFETADLLAGVGRALRGPDQ